MSKTSFSILSSSILGYLDYLEMLTFAKCFLSLDNT